jgi:hypothetical protein
VAAESEFCSSWLDHWAHVDTIYKIYSKMIFYKFRERYKRVMGFQEEQNSLSAATNKKWTIQRNWQHMVHKTKIIKAKNTT